MKRTNLLFIYTDEQSFNTLAAYGNEQIEMPHLNRLAAASSVFEKAYVTQPVCTPSRSTLLTGLYPHTNGCTENNIPLQPTTACLPEMLAAGDYATAHIGKWHLGDELFAQHGFAEWVSIEDGYNAYFSAGRNPDATSSYHDFLIANGLRPERGERFGRAQASRLPEEYGKPAFLAGEASRFIRAHQDQPFVLYLNFLEPHMPFFGPRDDQYDPASIPLPPNFAPPLDESHPLKARVLAAAYRQRGHSGLPLQTPEDWQRMIANYWGLCSLVDTHIGTVLDTLEECGLYDDTLVVFTSDHGDMMGGHQLLAKCLMFEEAVRVPLLIRLPGQRQGKHIGGPVSQIDIVPTLLDLLGQEIPEHLQGESLRPLLETANAHSEANVFLQWNGPNSGIVGEEKGAFQVPTPLRGIVAADELEEAVTDPVRTLITPEGWKLNYSPRGEHELYNLGSDPGENKNAFGQKELEPLVEALANQIIQWQKRTGDNVVLPPLKSRH